MVERDAVATAFMGWSKFAVPREAVSIVREKAMGWRGRTMMNSLNEGTVNEGGRESIESDPLYVMSRGHYEMKKMLLEIITDGNMSQMQQ